MAHSGISGGQRGQQLGQFVPAGRPKHRFPCLLTARIRAAALVEMVAEMAALRRGDPAASACPSIVLRWRPTTWRAVRLVLVTTPSSWSVT